MDRAHTAVARNDYDPSTERNNPDVQQALGAIGARTQGGSGNTVLEQGESGREVRKLESNLAGLGFNDAQGRALVVDGSFTGETKQAVENYQRATQLGVDGRAGPQTLGSIDQTVRGVQQNLTTLGINGANGQAIGIDGYYGNGTREAVRTFQQNNGIDPTGIADEATRRAIETAAHERTQSATPTQPGTAAPIPPSNDTTPTQPDSGTPVPAAPTSPQSFGDVMRVMLPPQNGTTPHMTSDVGPRSVVGGSSNHQGVNFNYVGGQNGTSMQHPTVRSPVSGVVVYGAGEGTYGTVKIRDDHGNMHEILHLDSRSVSATNPPIRIEAGDPIGTMGGRGPNGTNQYAQHVHYQVRDPNNTLIDPEAYWNNPARRQGQDAPQTNAPAPNASAAAADAPSPSVRALAPAAASTDAPAPNASSSNTPAPQRSEAMADHVLRRNESGQEVGHYQRILADLGYVGADGKALKVDEKFGPSTELAARQFQRDHGIETLGVIGPKTRAGVEDAGRELVTHLDNPNNRVFKQMLEKVHEAEDARKLPHGEHSRNLAAVLTVEMLRERLTTVDRVELSRDGSMARAVQFSNMGDKPELNRSTDGIATQQAVRQPIRESSEQAEQVSNNIRVQQAQEKVQAVAVSQGR
jgi:peptidoglycan hydrolase-like protein with peptidoglycan-binding domain